MAREQDKLPQGPEPTDLVPVMFAANMAGAEFYKTLLEDADIEAIIGTDEDESKSGSVRGIPVLVPAERLDDASDMITAREEMDEHLLASPDYRDLDEEEEEDDLTGRVIDVDTEEDLLFRRDPFTDKDDGY